MHFLLLGLGIALGIYALYRFFLQASSHQIKSFFITSLTVTLLLAVFFMAVTGRLPLAIGLFIALLPFLKEYVRLRKSERQESRANGQEQEFYEASSSEGQNNAMDKYEALDILGLEEGAGTQEINNAYKDLMKKLHPDTKGSKGLARKLNEARQVLLKKKQ